MALHTLPQGDVASAPASPSMSRRGPRRAASARIGSDGALLALLFAGACALVLLTFRGYGITWDEQWHDVYGERIISWYTSLFTDRSAIDFWVLKYYGGLFDVFADSVARFLPFDRYDTRHLCSAAFGLLGVAATYRTAALLAGRRAGLLAAASLLLIPRYYGHSFNNPKDIPFAAFYMVAVFYLLRTMQDSATTQWSAVLKFALATGLAMAIRVGGVLLIFFYAVAWLIGDNNRLALRQATWKSAREFTLRLGVILVIAYCVMLIAWPAAQVDPIRHPLASLAAFGHYPAGPKRVFFNGHDMATASLPWFYLIKWLLLTLPEFILAGLALALWLGVRWWRELAHSASGRQYLVCALAVLFPVAYAIITEAKLYDGARHFLFVIPLLAVFSAIAWSVTIRAAREARVLAAVVLAGGMVLTLRDMIELHPYEYLYFNHAIAGGLQNAARSYETDYWGDSYREGVAWVAAHYRAAPGQRIRVTSCSYPLSTAHFLPRRRFQYVPLGRGQADLFLATTRFGCDRTLAGRTVHVVSRQGATLLYIKEVSMR